MSWGDVRFLIFDLRSSSFVRVFLTYGKTTDTRTVDLPCLWD